MLLLAVGEQRDDDGADEGADRQTQHAHVAEGRAGVDRPVDADPISSLSDLVGDEVGALVVARTG